MEMLPPESCADDRDRILPRSLFLLVSPEEAADCRLDAQHVEIVSGYELSPNSFRLVVIPETQRPKPVCGHIGKGT